MAPSPQMDMLFLAVTVLASVASVSFFVGYLAHRSGRPTHATAASIVGLSATWYCVSMSLTLFNRMMLGYTAFSFPITMSLTHMAVKGTLGVTLALEAHRRSLPPGALPVGGGALARLRALARSLVRSQRLTRRVFSRVLVPLGTSTALDVWLSAVSLQTLDVSVYTVAKSCALIFTLGFSLAAGLLQLTPALAATVAGIGAGVIMCSVKDVGADPVGLLCVLLAAACGAARWVFTEQYYKRPGVHSNSLMLIAVLSPITVATLVPGLGWEVPRLVAHSPVHSVADVGVVLGMTLGGGTLAFMLLIAELQLVSMTSALTLNVIGHMKDIAVIGLAIPVLHEELSPINIAGVAVTLAATLGYSVIKARAHAEAEAAAAAAAAAAALAPLGVEPVGGGAGMVDGGAVPRRQLELRRSTGMPSAGGFDFAAAGTPPAAASIISSSGSSRDEVHCDECRFRLKRVPTNRTAGADVKKDFYQTNVVPLQTAVSVLMPCAYFVGVIYNIRRAAAEKQRADAAAAASHGHGHSVGHAHGDPRFALPRWGAVLLLLASTTLFALLAEVLTSSLSPSLAALGVTADFAGLTFIALIPNCAEFINGVVFAHQNELGLALEIGATGAMQLALIQMPVLFLLASSNAQPLQPADGSFDLLFPRLDLAVIIFAVVVFGSVTRRGKSTYFDGYVLLTTYCMILLAFWFVPPFPADLTV